MRRWPETSADFESVHQALGRIGDLTDGFVEDLAVVGGGSAESRDLANVLASGLFHVRTFIDRTPIAKAVYGTTHERIVSFAETAGLHARPGTQRFSTSPVVISPTASPRMICSMVADRRP